MDPFEVNRVIIPMYIESAKMYLQLSTGALALSIVFREKVLGDTGMKGVGVLVVLSWLFFLFAVGASALYQYIAIKFLDSISAHPGKIGFLGPLVAAPGDVYGMMLIFFVAGSFLLVASSVWQLVLRRRGE